MADKEATVFILDLGASMAKANSGRNESDLDWSMRYVWDKITDIVSANRKTLCVGVLGLRTDETENTLQDDDGYENIAVLQGLGQMTMPALRSLQTSIKPSKTWSGDAISAIVVAVDMIDTFTKKLKFIRRIFLITDGEADMDADDVGDIAQKMNDSNIQLTILGVDFDDAEYGFKQEEKSPTKAANEATLRELAKQCNDGVFATMAEAIDDLDTPRAKAVKPYKSYDGFLTLGDPDSSTAMSIAVERYFKTHLARPQGASTVVVKAETQSTHTLDDDPMDGVDFSAVKQARTYKVNDPDAPGGKRDVEFESLAKGYEYGRTAVHISESEHNITKIETLKSFSIVGFIPCDKYEPFLNMGETCITHARKNDTKSEIALSSLIWALHELDSYAVARIVTKDGKEPLLVLLAPGVEPTYDCLYDIPLPFAEDVRGYQFPPLDKVLTVSGQTLTKHRLLPSDELSKAMDDYVDAMDLSGVGSEENQTGEEYAPMDEAYNPSIHRINHAIKQRAVHPESPVAATPAELLKFSAPPEYLVEKIRGQIDTLIDAAEVKRGKISPLIRCGVVTNTFPVPPKAKGRRNREAVKPISGLDVDALLGEERKGSISQENPVPDFKRALAVAEEVGDIENAAKQMATIVRSLVTDSFGDSKYAQAMECIGTMRDELINLEEPDVYNTFVRDLKKGLLSGALGGDRRDFWFKVRWSRQGLVDQDQSEVSKVTHEEAEEVCARNPTETRQWKF
uniref:ATP-dependent DNA helicase II subunit 2 n=1 Tax=Purpureocillium lavendulum TaxID=1247861 RepID=A0A3B8DE33_9HYPO|nr:Ku family DNA helicase [Purpureocillium lavendulum]